VAPTIEAFSNVDNTSEAENNYSLYKSGREKVTTLGIADRGGSPKNMHQKSKKVSHF